MDSRNKDKHNLNKRLQAIGIRGLPAITPLPDITPYKTDPYKNSFLMNYHQFKKQREYEATRSSLPKVKGAVSANRLLATNGPRISLDLKERKMEMLAFLYGRARLNPLPPLDEKWISRILIKIPIGYDPKNRELEELLNEVRSQYTRVLSTATANFVRHRLELQKRLFLLDPSMRVLLSLCKDVLGTTLILQCTRYRSLSCLSCHDLLEEVQSDCFNAEDKVLHSWFPQVVEIVSKPKAKKSQSTKNEAAFYKCVTSVLSAQLKELVHRSLQAFVDTYTNCRDFNFPILKLTLGLDETTIVSSPTLTEIHQLISQIIHQVVSCLNQIPTVESWLSNGAVSMMDTSLPDTVVQMAQRGIEESVDKHFAGPKEVIDKLVKAFNDLIDGQAMRAIEEFLGTEHAFEDYCQLIDHYHGLIFHIQNLRNVHYFPMFSVFCSDLKQLLIQAAALHRDHLLEFVARLNRQRNLRICKELAHVKGRMKKCPATTREMIELIAYVDRVEVELLPKLENDVKDSYARLIYLLNLYKFNHEDFTLNGFTLTVPSQIKPLIENCKEMIEDCKLHFDEGLQNRIEKLGAEIEKLQVRVRELERCGTLDAVPEYMQDVRSIEKRISDLHEIVKGINEEEALFGFQLSSYSDLEDVVVDFNLFKGLFSLVVMWQKLEAKWMDGDFLDLDAEVIEFKVGNFGRDFLKMQKVFRARQMQQEGDNRRSVRWDDKEEGELVSPPVKLCLAALDRIRDFKQHMPVINTLCRPGVRPRHFHQMSQLCGYQLLPETGGTNLRTVLHYDLESHLERLEVVAVGASKEYAMERAIQKMVSEWDHVLFATIPYRDTGVNVLSAVDDIQLLLEEHVIKLQTMRGSPYVRPFEDEVRRWEARLSHTQLTIDQWLKVQAQWMYLEPIFSSADIVHQMPAEGRLFVQVDREWRALMKIVWRDPKVMSTAGDVDTLPSLLQTMAIVEEVNRGLNDYLEQKRLFFPRFFFLSNDDILEVLSETKDPSRVQPHLRKCFEGIDRLDFAMDGSLDIVGVVSAENEHLDLMERISTTDAGGQVEKWLLHVQETMLASVRAYIDRAWTDHVVTPLQDWVVRWPGQVVLCVSQLDWTRKVHQALTDDTTDSLCDYLAQLDSDLVDIVRLVRGRLSRQTRVTLNSYLVIAVHARDVVATLLDRGVTSPLDFHWLAQLRYYWTDDGHCVVRIAHATIGYAYEYLGNTPRLVITPLTDRCYRTLVGAFHLHLNGAPEGPAGTGKTETVKDLAKALAIHCVVFNCSDGLDHHAMGKFFKGLASAGAWACFDEFNRIDPEVLSVVAQQMLTIVQAVRAGLNRFVFDGTEIRLDRRCFTCITQNPGYAGRSELPENLKALFRTVAMMVPDYVTIAEISLYSYGFVGARPLAVKIVTTYRLCSELLSSQGHYDYGMRAVKTVLATAGTLKLQWPDDPEDLLVLRAILDVNLPKFLPHDIPLFEGIVSDLFPGVTFPTSDHGALLSIVEEECQTRHLVATDHFCRKLVQVYETLTVRHGFMLVGETLSGKTTLLRVLAAALTKLNSKQVEYRVVNPKAVTMGQLYGQFDSVSREWTDGIVASAFRDFIAESECGRNLGPTTDEAGQAASEASTSRRYVSIPHHWLVFDGPADTLWIENLNAVLDDNRKLCLLSGEVIAMPSTMSVVFEVSELMHASPATVSRCGMVYVEPQALGWKPLVESWIGQTLVQRAWAFGHRELLHSLCSWLIEPVLQFLQTHCSQLIPVPSGQLVLSLVHLMDGVMDDACSTRRDTEVKYANAWIVAAFTFSVIWSLGGVCDVDGQHKLSGFLRPLLAGKCTEHPMPPEVGIIEVQLPSDGVVHDYVYEFQQKGQWRAWSDRLWQLDAEVDGCTSVWQLIVPTVDTVRCGHLVDRYIGCPGHSLLFAGPTGTGKSAYIRNKLLHELPADRFVAAFVSLTPQMTSGQTQNTVLGHLEKRHKGHFGPPSGKRLVVFLDDLHLTTRATNGDQCQPPLELLRQYFDYGFWYHSKELAVTKVTDMTFVGAIQTPAGSLVSPRFLSHFHVVAVNPFADDTLRRIFSATLGHHYRSGYFPVDALASVQCVVPATLDVYKWASRHLLPTPSKVHYGFSVRDAARVILGCCLLRREAVTDRRTYVRIWTHEILRVFADRLVDDDDRRWFCERIREAVKHHFRDHFDLVFERLRRPPSRRVTDEDLCRLMFTDHLQPDVPPDDRRYEEVISMDAYRQIVEAAVVEYNATHQTPVSLVVFPDVLDHLSRIGRVLRIPAGHCLLVGPSGSGRRTLARLAAAMSGCHLVQPEVTGSYGHTEWREDLKSVLRTVGTQGKPTVLLVTDGHLKRETFLEEIDTLLNSGHVPNLFTLDERQDIIQLMRSSVITSQAITTVDAVTPLALFSAFVARCRENLHVVIAFGPESDVFRRRLRRYPSLVTCCTIDWFRPWPGDALECVARHTLRPLELGPQTLDSVLRVCRHFHLTAHSLAQRFADEQRHRVHVTPTAFLHLLETFISLLTTRETMLQTVKQRYEAGLKQLVLAAIQVSDMQIQLETLQPQLLEATSKTKEMMMVIESESEDVEQKRAHLTEDEALVNLQASQAKALRDECETDLAEAIPALEAAIAALDTLKPADVTVLKSMKSPPPAVKLVMEAICVMIDVKPERIADPRGAGAKIFDYWAPSKKLLGDLGFLTKLKEYDKDNIPVAVVLKIRKDYLPNPEFNPSVVAKASSAAEGLCKWVCAMELYDRTAKIVAPKKAKLQEADEQLTELVNQLDSKRKELTTVEHHLAKLKHQLSEILSEKQRLEEQTDLCALKLRRARDLIDGLGGEKERWNSAKETLSDVLRHLMGDVLLAAGVIAYLGPFTASYRAESLEDWTKFLQAHKIDHSNPFSISKTLGDPLKIQTWTIAGLPNDAFSIDNAVIVDSTRKCPLMIDPQSQANKWIKATEQANGLVVVKPSDVDYQRMVAACVQNGKPLLIEDVGDSLDPTLEPLLLKQTFKQGGVEMIRFGDQLIEYNDGFRLMLTTRLHQPQYPPDVTVKVCLVNFMITVDGLEDQLLGLIVAKERPELECAHQDFIVQSSKNHFALKDIEDKILVTLSTSEGNILEDETAIRVLDSSQHLADEINARQMMAEETEQQIIESRLNYRPVARHSAILFFCLTELRNVDPMYEYSLAWFVRLFESSIVQSEKSDVLADRLWCLSDHFTHSIYVNVCRSLFEKDKLLFPFMLSCSLLLANNKLIRSELMFFLTGGVGLDVQTKNPDPVWITDQSWQEICRLSDLEAFSNLKRDFVSNPSEWRRYFENPSLHMTALPEPWNTSLTDFQKMCVLRCLRPDKVIPAVKNFVRLNLGDRFVQPPSFDLAQSYQDSSTASPLLFILSPGVDPLTALQRFGTHKGVSMDRLHIVSLGQGQGPLAQHLIENAKATGDWVLLQNCHLAVSWLPTLEVICEGLLQRADGTTTHPDFRLWLTSYPSEKFPVSILQSSIKMTNEPPSGLKQCLLRVYQDEPINNMEFFDGCFQNKEKTFRKLLFGLSFFHALVSERRKYGPIGWNIPYAFNDSDLTISLQQVQMFVNDYDVVPFEALNYMIGECNYGGRVTDDWDRRTLITLLEDVCNQMIVEEDGYQFSPSGNYVVPQCSAYEEYLGYIQNLPSEQDPEVFGMHANVDVSHSLQESRFLWNSLLLTHGRASAGQCSVATDVTADKVVKDITNDILNKLPLEFDLKFVAQKYPMTYSNSMNTVLIQEMDRYNRLLSIMRTSLVSLQNALDGLVMMSVELESMAASLSIGKIPESWAAHSYPSLKPLGSYVNDLLERLQFIQTWFEKGTPSVFWLPGFYFTQAFLTAILQNHARKYTIPIDRLIFDFKILPYKTIKAPPNDGGYISGLYMEGARWDREIACLAEQRPGQLWDPMPIIWLVPTVKNELIEGGRYHCPLYKTRERRGTLSTTGHSTNYVLTVLLTTDRPVSHWIKRGTALICQLDN